MIKVKGHDIQIALVAFSGMQMQDGSVVGGIGNEKLPPKAAYRVSRLISKLRSEMRIIEEEKARILKQVGGEARGRGAEYPRPVKGKDESEEAFREREEKWKEGWKRFEQEVTEMLEDDVEIDYDPIPLSLFEIEGKTPNLSPNELASVEPFITDEDEKRKEK